MKYPLVRELSRDGIPVTVTCRVLKFSTQGYYQWLREPWSPRDYENAYLTNAAYDAHRDDPEFGYRFLADEVFRPGASQRWDRLVERATGEPLSAAHLARHLA